MKIGVYARGLSEKVGGAKQVIESMTRSLVMQVGDESQLFIIHNCNKKMFDMKKANVEEITLSSNNKFIADFFLAPRIINKLDLDVVWFPKNVVPYRISAKKIVTVLDLIYFMPEYNAYPFIDTIYMKTMIRSSCKKADKIISISENTKRDITSILGVHEKNVEVLLLGADERYGIIDDEDGLNKIRDKYGLEEKFILHTGGISPRKNIIRLIKALNEMPDDIPHELVLTGGKGWKNREELKLIERNDRIRQLGFVDDEDMPYLYNLADLYVYPSLYEGFGLPILEAQACGCPVICSNVSSIPEVGGEAVLYINPISITDIKEKIQMLVMDASLKIELINKGLENVKRFSWEKSANKLLKLMEAIQYG